jgi:hypothetical protein
MTNSLNTPMAPQPSHRRKNALWIAGGLTLVIGMAGYGMAKGGAASNEAPTSESQSDANACLGTVITIRHDDKLDCTVARDQVVDVRWPQRDFHKSDVAAQCNELGGELGVDDVFGDFVCKAIDVQYDTSKEAGMSELELIALDHCQALLADDEATSSELLSRYAAAAGISEQKAAGVLLDSCL